MITLFSELSGRTHEQNELHISTFHTLHEAKPGEVFQRVQHRLRAGSAALHRPDGNHTDAPTRIRSENHIRRFLIQVDRPRLGAYVLF